MVHSQWIGILASGGAIACTLSLATETVAQIIPDNSLGLERSVVTPNIPNQNGTIDRIEGGAIRGSNLFHSFQDFNVNPLQRVYFANPSGIENILGRVTGNQASQIQGTLGVLGNANLYLVNPNGIVFGKNARLDIRGSFFASTSNSLVLENGYQFRTDNPTAPPLLTINVRPGLETWLPPQGAIANTGNLSAGQHLTLVGNNLDLQGQLQAGGNLTLQATDTLKIRDTITDPFIAAAGSQMLLQGNQKLDISALNHPQSGLFAGGNLIVRSANGIRGDTRYTTGGSFSIQRLDGSAGNLTSEQDPIVLAAGDVSIGDYTGASLHILAGGSVRLGNVTIDRAGVTETTINSSNGNTISGTNTAYSALSPVTLSDGTTTLSINGDLQATLDVRAGIDWTQSPFGAIATPIALPPGSVAVLAPPASGSSITAGTIRITQPNGLVLLTNQYRPNLALTGQIEVNSINAANPGGGGIAIADSRGNLTIRSIDVSGGDISTNKLDGNGGTIHLRADGNIVLPFFSTLFSYGTVGGRITLASKSAIIQADAPPGTSSNALSIIDSLTAGSGTGGDVSLSAPTISLGGNVLSTLQGSGQSGQLTLTADSLTTNRATVSTATFGAGNSGRFIVDAKTISLNESFLGSVTFSPVGGNAGDVDIQTNSLAGTNGAQIFSLSGGIGNTGNVTVTASDAITLRGTSAVGFPSGIGSTILQQGQGDGGTVTVQASSLSLSGGAQIRASTQGIGNAGRVQVDVANTLAIDGTFVLPNSQLIPSAILSEVLPGARGRGNEIQIRTGQLLVSNGGFISASTASTGDAGSILIDASESAAFTGNTVAPFQPSGVFVGTLRGATGQGGTLTINTPSLSVTNGAQLEALTESAGNAGNIILNVRESIFLSGADTGLFSNTAPGSTGNGGNISIDPERIEIRDGAAISVDSQGSGRGGSIEIQANRFTLDNATISAQTASSDGGNITLALSNLLVLRRGSQISTTAGNAGAGGDGGNIRINAPFVVAIPQENSDITANAFLGRGGNVDITATSIFGLAFQPQLTPLSDITASSQFGVSGTVSLNTPEVDPGSGLVALPAQLSDPSDRVVVGCAAARGNSFTVTGRGGLPENPTTAIASTREQTVWEDLEDYSTVEATNLSSQTLQSSRSQLPVQLVEATGWVTNHLGQVELVARSPNDTFMRAQSHFPHCNDLQRLSR